MEKARIAFFDVDGTLTSDNVWKGLMAYFQHIGRRRFTHLGFLVYHYPIYILKAIGFVDEIVFRRNWAHHLGWYFRGFTVEEAKSIWSWIVKDYLTSFWREEVLQQLRKHILNNDLVLLVSAGPHPLIQAIATHVGATVGIGTKFEIRNGVYTGKTLGHVCLDEQKYLASRAWLETAGVPYDLADCYAYADSITDLGLLELVGHPVAVYPDAALLNEAYKRKWQIYPSGYRVAKETI